MNKKFKILKTLKSDNFGGKYSVETVSVEAPDGNTHTFYLRKGPPFSIIIPLIDSQTCVMVEQHRLGSDSMTLEFPMGQVDGAEDAAAIARQELLEETGYESRSIDVIASFYPAPGWSNQLAHVCVARELKEGKARPEPTEFLEIKYVKLTEIDELIKTRQIYSGNVITAWYYFKEFFGENAVNVR